MPIAELKQPTPKQVRHIARAICKLTAGVQCVMVEHPERDPCDAFNCRMIAVALDAIAAARKERPMVGKRPSSEDRGRRQRAKLKDVFGPHEPTRPDIDALIRLAEQEMPSRARMERLAVAISEAARRDKTAPNEEKT